MNKLILIGLEADPTEDELKQALAEHKPLEV